MSTSGLLSAAGTALQIVGAVLMVVPGAQGAGALLLAQGTALQIGAALTMRPPRPGRSASSSPTYGVDVFQNPRTDAWIPWVTGVARVVPPIVQEYAVTMVEGRGFAVREQGVAMLLKAAWGPVRDITGIELNGEPLYSEEQTETFSGNGSTKTFELSATNISLPSLSVEVGGTEVAQKTTSSDKAYTLVRPSQQSDGTTPLSYVELTVPKRQRILDETVRVYVGDNAGSATERKRDDSLYGWQLRRVSRRKFRVRFKNPPLNQHIRVVFSYLGPSDLQVLQDGRGRTKLVFGTAPASGTKNIACSFVRENFPGTKVWKRLGTLDQEAIPGFGDSRNTRTPNNTGAKALSQNSSVEETTSKTSLHDLVVGIKAPQGLVRYSKSGGVEKNQVKVVIEWRPGSTAQWRVLRFVGNEEKVKSEFLFAGMTQSEKRWEISIRETLQDLFDAGLATSSEEDDLEALGTTALHVRVTRKDPVQNDSNSLSFDRLEFSYVTEVVDAELIHPGQALLALRIPAERLGAASPFVTCVVDRGDIYDPRTGGVSSSRNPALAVYDLIVSGRSGSDVGWMKEAYGGGWDFDESDLDLVELQAFANWCDETVTNPDGTTEKRHELDLVLDVPLSLSEAVFDICSQARCLATLQGTTWRFPLDKAGTSVATFYDSTVPASANIVEGSFEVGPHSYVSTPTEVLVQFRNRSKNFDQDEVLVPVENLPAGTLRNVQRVEMLGVTRLTEAVRNGAHLAEDAWKAPVLCTWLAHPGAHLVEAGDLVTVNSTTPGGTVAAGWASQVVRVLRISKELTQKGALRVRYLGRIYSAQVKAKASTSVPTYSGEKGNTVIGGSFGNPPKSAATGTKLVSSRKGGATNLRSRQVL